MHPASRVAVAVAVLLLPCARAFAEEPPARVEPGARVRVTLPCEPELPPAPGAPEGVCREEGRVVSVEGQRMTLATTTSTRDYPLNGMSLLEVSRGRRSHWRAGVGAGFVIGAGGTFALLNRGDSTNPCDSSANQDAIGMGACVGLATLGGVAGAGVGALIGKLIRTEEWQRVPADRVRVSVAPRAGLELRVALTF